MKPSSLDSLLSSLPSEVPVPSGLSERVMRAVEKRSVRLERSQVLWASVRLALGVTALLYGFTATVLNLMNSNITAYLSLAAEDPSLLMSADGLRGLWEQVPILSSLVFLGGLAYSVRHFMIKGMNARRLSSVMAALFVVVAGGAFMGGIAVGVNTSTELTAMASETLFNPLVTNSNEYRYSSSGEVTSVDSVNGGTVLVTILLPNGTEKIVEVPKNVLGNKRVIEEGDRLFIMGKPSGPKGKFGSIQANFVRLSESGRD